MDASSIERLALTLIAQCITAASIRFENYTFHYLLAVDLITDCSSEFLFFLDIQRSSNMKVVISIPILMLWNVRIPLKQKLGLIGIFSLTVIVMVFAIIRVVVVNKFSKQADITWLYFWTNLEMSVGKYLATPSPKSHGLRDLC